MNDKDPIILIDKRRFVDYSISIPDEHVFLFELVMKSHGWKPVKKGDHKNQPITIERMMQEEK